MVAMETVSLQEIQVILNKLLDNSMTREDASSWAFRLREAADNYELEFIPSSKEDLIWELILFLEGVDLKDSPDSYLHNQDDIRLISQKI